MAGSGCEFFNSLFEKVVEQAKNLEQKTRTKITFQSIDAKSIPAPMDESMQKLIIQSAIELGYSYKFMPSGAGHDAQNMATIVPTGMIFMPGVGGISHSPKEYTRPGDMVKGANVLLHSAASCKFQVPNGQIPNKFQISNSKFPKKSLVKKTKI